MSTSGCKVGWLNRMLPAFFVYCVSLIVSVSQSVAEGGFINPGLVNNQAEEVVLQSGGLLTDADLGGQTSDASGSSVLLAIEDAARDVGSWFVEFGEWGSETLESNLRVNEVEVSGNYYTPRKQLMADAELEERPWFWQTSAAKIRARLERNPWVERAEVDRSVLTPDRLKVKVEEARPWLVGRYQGQSWLISRSGRLLLDLSAITQPELVVEASELPRLEVVNEQLQVAIKSVVDLDGVGGVPFDVASYEAPGLGILVAYPVEVARHPVVRFQIASKDDARDQLARLRQTLSDLRQRDSRALEIDLRFAGQAVVKERPAEELTGPEAANRGPVKTSKP